MKAKTFHITSLSSIQEATKFIIGLMTDGKFKVVISNAGSKNSKQRGLDWMWNEDVAKSGIGAEHWDTDKGVHLISKFMFAIPIFQRDDSRFSDLYDVFIGKYEGDRDMMMWFVENNVSTEKFDVSQMAEYLTSKKNFFGIKHGVNLRDPEFRGLLDGKRLKDNTSNRLGYSHP